MGPGSTDIVFASGELEMVRLRQDYSSHWEQIGKIATDFFIQSLDLLEVLRVRTPYAYHGLDSAA